MHKEGRRRRRIRRRSQLQRSLSQQCSRVVLVGLGYHVLYLLVNKEEEEEEKEEEEIEEELAVVCFSRT